jgi:adenine specific DNA methylase Mod
VDEYRPKILTGDNLKAMRWLLSQGGAERTMLVYMDPPFYTQRAHTLEDGRVAFDDRWESRGHYLTELRERVRVARELLHPRGSLVLHLNSRVSHYAKVMVDGEFGEDNFASEIVWRYRRWPTKTPNFQRMHDVLLRWRKDMSWEPRWNQLYEPIAESTRKTWGTKKQKAIVEEGRRARSSSTEEETKGVPLGDVWDIGVIAPSSKERTGWPTQKPQKLLERLIEALTDEGDLILDPYAGSGTTLAAAQKLKRESWGIDASDEAVRVALRRLSEGVHSTEKELEEKVLLARMR